MHSRTLEENSLIFSVDTTADADKLVHNMQICSKSFKCRHVAKSAKS